MDRDPASARASAFTLVELIVVVGIVAVLVAMLFPVFAKTREKARQTSCISNERQLGLAILQYAQDNNEVYPCGLGLANGERVWAGEGWAGQCSTYVRNSCLYSCPVDRTVPLAPSGSPVSYGYNINFVENDGAEDNEYAAAPSGVKMAALIAPARSVLLFEVSGVLANPADPREGADPGGSPGRNYSASSNGLDNRLYAQRTWSTTVENQYATGYLAGRMPPNPDATQFGDPAGRHSDGSNFLIADGHALWLPGAAVSSGMNATRPDCPQDNVPAHEGCEGAFHAAGTSDPVHAATFSIR